MLSAPMLGPSTIHYLRHSSQAARLFRPSSPSLVDPGSLKVSSGIAAVVVAELLFKFATGGKVPHIKGSTIVSRKRTKPPLLCRAAGRRGRDCSPTRA